MSQTIKTYLDLMERPIVLFIAPGQDPTLVLPELEMLKVTQFPYKVQAFPYGENPSEWDHVFRKAAQALGLDGKRIGVRIEDNLVITETGADCLSDMPREVRVVG